jgi:predicted nicotinamide N-methyase
MGALSRSFIIPLDPEPVTLSGDAGDGFTINQVEAYIGLSDEYVELTLHEPALTGDDLGLKTWASSYLLAKRMATLRNTLPVMPPGEMVLELGSGTGLVGLAAACILGRHTILTDLPEIVDNLNRNSQANALTLSSHGGHTDTAVLDWSRPETFLLEGKHTGEAHMFPLILAADPIYSSDHPRLLAQAVEYHLSQSPHARVVVEMPLRDAYVAERDDFRSRMSKIGLVVVETGEEIGYDDWSTGDEDEPSEVRCWWSVWARRSSPLGGP